jgi:phage terminase large subunit-like protein
MTVENILEKQVAAAVRKLNAIERDRAYDPMHPETRPTEQQLEVLKSIQNVAHRYCRGGNQSGKSQCAGRDLSWFLLGNHPYFKRPVEWGNEPLMVIVIGRITTQVEEELWAKKLKPFFKPGTYREIRTGNVLQKVKFANGDTILFASHHAPEEAAQKMQSYVAHYVWLDEMPGSVKLIEEIHRRLQAKRGRLLATFTPKVKNEEIRRLVDTPSKVHKRFDLHMLQNPIYKGREEEIHEQLKTYPEQYRKTILYGDWYSGDNAVYSLNRETQVALLPMTYSRNWRHVLSVDPAASGKVGVTLWGEDPATATWYCILAKYLNGQAASDLDNAIEKLVANYNLKLRISDPHEAWFIKETAKLRRFYVGVYKKNERKKELIKQVQEKLNENKIKITPECVDLINEFTQCQWDEKFNDRIVGAKRFHLLDATQYFVDNIPKPMEQLMEFASFDHELKYLNKVRKKKEKLKMMRMGKKRRKSWSLGKRAVAW